MSWFGKKDPTPATDGSDKESGTDAQEVTYEMISTTSNPTTNLRSFARLDSMNMVGKAAKGMSSLADTRRLSSLAKDATKIVKGDFNNTESAGTDFMDEIDFETKVESRASMNEIEKLSALSDDEIISYLKSGNFSKASLPTAHAVIASCMIAPHDARIDFVEGVWVERLGHDMCWHLDRVTTVHKIMDDDVDWSMLKEGEEAPWTAYYDFHSQKMLNKAKLRHPEEGLKRIFGRNPWLWQQYAVLKVEEQIRFQQNHYKDFDKIDIDMLAKNEWDKFINHEGNEELKARFDDPRFANARSALLHHILSPFRVMEGLRNAGTSRENDGFNTDWDMSDERLSAYTYLGVLGSGWLVPLLCVFVQFSAPLLLWAFAVSSSDRNDSWCDQSEEWSNDKIKGKLMMFTITILYLSKIVPDAVFNFIRSVGEGIDAHSKVMALRKLLWDRGEDFNLGQMIGYKLDLYMNTGYVCLLYTLNLFILFNQDDVIEMMLNAMAVEFVLKMDEDFASTDWWDPDKRWIRAGALELTIGSTLRKSYLSSAVKFEKHFDISRADLVKVLGEGPVKGYLLQDEELANKDKVDSSYLTPEDATNLRMANLARANGLDDAFVKQFEKPVVSFGVISRIFAYFFPKRGPNTLFNRNSEFYTWSMWHNLMYGGLSKIPPAETVYDFEKNKSVSPNDHMIGITEEDSVTFANFSFQRNADKRAIQYLISILTLVEFWRGPTMFLKRGEPVKCTYRLVDGVVMWFNVFVQCGFPIFILFCAFVIPSCY